MEAKRRKNCREKAVLGREQRRGAGLERGVSAAGSH